MSSLPPALAAWSDVLDAFAPDLAEAIGVLALRLDLVIGRVRARPRPLGDDPDGYTGLDRRGPYDRLVLSEWALADAVPEEFDRRAASGEQAFLRLDRRDRSRGVRCVALFDGGPDQLGGPRVVQLAALVVLWRRARAAGAEFAWGPLTAASSPAPLQSTVDRATVQALLGGRTGRPVTTDDVAAARERAGEADELWLIGGPLDTRAPGALSLLAPRAGAPAPLHLSLSDVIAPGAHAVDVRLTRGGSPLGEARLALPAPALARRLLVDPFRPLEAPASTSAPPPPDPQWLPLPRGYRDPTLVRFMLGTEQLVVLCARGTVLSWGFDAGRPKSPKPKVRTISADPLVALGYHKQHAHALSRSDEGGLKLSWSGEAIPPQRINGPPPHVGPGTLVLVGSAVLFLDVAGTLYRIDTAPMARVDRLVGNVVLLFALHQHALFVERRDDRLFLREVRPGEGLAYVLETPGDAAWIGRGGERLLVESAGRLYAWRLAAGAGSSPCKAEPMTAPAFTPEYPTILGVAHHAGKPVTIACDPTGLLFHHQGTGVTVTAPRRPIAPTVSPDGSVVAWRTEEGFVEAWSLVTGAPVLQRHGG